ncbi:DUF5711 family protein [Anaerotruncus rubiinfantis]|uniref:DUF5711 family protein n=1 Tax=Anaerotruncus rubiinfantis TaxID=1720200 RepID=UPI0034A116F2
MAQLTDLEKVRRRRSRRRTIRNLMILAVFALIVALCVSLIKYAGELDLATAYSDIKAGIVTGEGYPVTLPGGQISRLEASEDVLFLLSDTNLYSYNASGRQLLNAQHNMGTPSLSTAGDRVLLYDRGGTRVSIYSKSAQTATVSFDHTIYTADIAQNGNYAVAAGSDETLAKVAVYNRSGQNIFNWLSTKPIVSVSLSDNRDYMLVGHVDVSDGSYRSNISKFQFSINEGAIASVDLDPGELLLWVDYRGGNTIRALTDKRVVLFNGDLKELASFPFGSEKLDRVVNRSNGRLVIVLGSFAQEKQMRVVTLADDFSKLADFRIDYDLMSVKTDLEHIYLATKDGIEIRGSDGTLQASLPVANLHNLEPMQGILYYTTNAEIRAADVKELTAPKEEKDQKGQSSSNGKKPDASTSGQTSGGRDEDSESGNSLKEEEESAAQEPEESALTAVSDGTESQAPTSSAAEPLQESEPQA